MACVYGLRATTGAQCGKGMLRGDNGEVPYSPYVAVCSLLWV